MVLQLVKSCLHVLLWQLYRLALYNKAVIRSFRDSGAERLFRDEFSTPYQAIERPARRRLAALDSAERLKDLNAIQANHLDKLSGNRVGQLSVCINAQYRICFVWTDQGPADVEIEDYR